jgi:hypothetical protein
MISPTQILDVNTDLVAGEVVDGEAVIINLSNGMYYTMDGVGAEVWQLIERRRSMHDMAGEIAARYGVDRETVLGDLRVVVAELVAEDLVRAANGSSAPEDAPVELARPDGALCEARGHPLRGHERGARARPSASGARAPPRQQVLKDRSRLRRVDHGDGRP